MSFLLDTNACIGVISGKGRVRERFNHSLAFGDKIFTSSIAVFELWYGVARSDRQERNRDTLATLLSGPLDVLAFNEDDAEHAGAIKGHLAQAGRFIGPYDVLIAGQAMNRTLTLVTANTREFARVDGLEIEDWSVAAV